MIRNTVLIEIREALSSHDRFEDSDFNINTTIVGVDTRIKITYLGDKQYVFEFSIPVKKDDKFKGRMIPGGIAYSEDFTIDTISSVYTKISSWERYIWEELQSNPVIRLQIEQQEILNQILSKFDIDSKEYYSAKEGEDLKNRLDDLEQKYRDLLTNLIKDTKQREAKIKTIKKDIETLKSTVTGLNKGFWNRSLFGKMAKWGADKDNRDLVKQLVDYGSELLKDQKLLG